MALSNSDKIFVDVNDEINFLVEQIKSSASPRIIVVIPHNALVISSLVSMKILAKQVLSTDKLVIITTEDKFGLDLADRAGLIGTPKVSNIVPQLWEAAQIMKEKQKQKASEVKHHLLTERGIIPVPEKALGDAPEPSLPEKHILLGEELEEVEPEVVEPVAEVVEKEPEVVPEPATRPAIQRTRREPKLVKVNNLDIYVGGDITQMGEETSDVVSHAKATDDISMLESASQQTLPANVNDEADMTDRLDTIAAHKVYTKSKINSFTGKDWSSFTNKPSTLGVSSKLGGIFGRKKTDREEVVRGREVEAPIKPRRRISLKKKLAIFLALVFIFASLSTYVFAFTLSTVDIRVTLKTESVPINDLITADTNVTAIDEANIVIPATVLTVTDLSASASDTATGTGQKGDKASGVLDFLNKTTNQVTLASGTQLTNTTTNLVYILKKDITIPAAQPSNQPDIVNIATITDQPIEAIEIGDQYNITEVGSVKNVFKVDGYDTSQVSGSRVRKIEGGTSTPFKAVSADDVKRVHDKLVEQIKPLAMTRLKAAVKKDEYLIAGTETFKDTATTSIPDVGQEATGTYTVSIAGEMKGVIVKQADLQKAITLLINKGINSSINFEVTNLDQLKIENVTNTDGVVKFTINSSGNISGKITTDTIKRDIAGMTITEANAYLSSIKEIDKYKLTFNPAFVPEAIKRIPSNVDHINVFIN